MRDPILIPDNPLWPLPHDYVDLTAEGQRMARVNAAQQWRLPGTAAERAYRMVGSLDFFDRYYLRPDPDDDFDPLFYEVPPLATPDMHWAISRFWATQRYSVIVAPRGSAKSTHCRRDMVMRMVTDKHTFAYVTSTHDNARYTSNIVRDQCYSNRRIQDDFCRHWGVDSLKPGRSEKSVGQEHFFLTHGSWARFASVQSRIRGIRAMRFRLDDPEFDPSASTSMEVMRQNLHDFLFNVAVPTVTHANAGIDWIGTYVSPRHYLWHAMTVVDTPEGPRAMDPRFNYWARFFIPAAYEDEETHTVKSCWPEMWPATEVERREKGLDGALSLERLREVMGAQAFNKEMLGKMGAADGSFFKLDHDQQGKHAYWYKNVDPLLATDPRNSESLICWRGTDGVVVETPMRDFLRRVRLFITVDSSYTEHTHSDRKVATLMAMAADNNLFVLDMWSDRKEESVLLEQTLGMADRWRCALICVEVVKESLKTYNRFKAAVKTRFSEDLGLGFAPKIKDLRPGTMDKPSKISTLDTRFDHNLIKLPLYARTLRPHWDRLISQIEEFTPSVQDGGLQHDDELDTVAMHLLVVKGRVSTWVAQEDTGAINVVEALRRGERFHGSVDLLASIDPSMLSAREMADILQANAQHTPHGRSRV